MAPSLLWTDNLGRLAQGSGGAPADTGRARFPMGAAPPTRPPPAAPNVPSIPPRPHLTPTRVALPGTPEFAAAQLLARPPAPAPRPNRPLQAAPAAPTPARVLRPPSAARAPLPVAAAQPPAHAAPAGAPTRTPAPRPPPIAPVAPPAAQPRSSAPGKPRSLSDLAAVPARLAVDLGIAQRGGVAPVTTSSAAWQRPTFKSVELKIESLDLEMAALAQQGVPPPALTSVVSGPEPEPASEPAAPAQAVGIAQEVPPVPDESLPEHPIQAGLASGLIEAQLAGFLEAAVSTTGAAAAFVADADGLEMANHLATSELLAVSALMGRHVVEMRELLKAESEGALAFELDADNLLQVAWVDTELGRLALGLVVHQVPAATALSALRERLREAARRPTSRRAKPALPPVNDSVF